METPDYSEIGRLFRQAREEKGMSLEGAAHMLHIRQRYLAALEEGNLAELPGLPYIKGYLQAYAAFLDLDRQEIVRRFEGAEQQFARRGLYLPQAFSREKKPGRRAVWGSLAAALAIIGLWLAAHAPSGTEISPVEDFPTVSLAAAPQDDACFQSASPLYPPCTMTRKQLDLVPLGPVTSVMELAPFLMEDHEPDEAPDLPEGSD
ncbi:MAG: helix-turn-helix domain-containing protein [Pseudomonadota bacterium]|nr:helix-turn-helix domain-containing protein [Pseudomonadota bacterium]